MKALLAALSLLLAASLAQAGISTRNVSYPAGNITAKGFLAIPEGKGKHPGVLVVHEFWGLNGYARERAKMLAKLGYVALAVDMYGDGKVAAHPKDAMSFMNAVIADMPQEKERFLAAMKYLQSQPEVEPSKIAAVGYCFGGGVVLQMAADDVPGLLAVASFHGSLGTKFTPGGKVSAKVLVCHGGEDSFATPQIVAEFQKNFKATGADFTFVSYPGAKHAFSNPDATKLGEQFGLDIAYDASADKKSWAALQEFLKAAFAAQ